MLDRGAFAAEYREREHTADYCDSTEYACES